MDAQTPHATPVYVSVQVLLRPARANQRDPQVFISKTTG